MYFNISGATDVALLSPGDNISGVKTIHIANTHSSDEVEVDLYISTISRSSEATTYYLMKCHKLEKGGYVNLESDILSFRNNSSIGYGLFISLNNTTSTVDVLIKQ